jgi:UDP-glucose:(heptosyl)LPS alpha-1,3-glucosyltransferase
VLLARSLVSLGVEVHCYCNPDTRIDMPEVTFHDVRPLARSRSRFGYPLECASFAAAATRALRRDRGLYDVIDVCGIAAWEHDVVSVHGVMKADQGRWAASAGSGLRAARVRGRLAPLTRPQVGVARMIERRQLRPGSFRRVIAVTAGIRRDLEDVYGVPSELIDVIPPPVDVASFASAQNGDVRRSLGIPAGDPLLLFLGHDFRRKGLAIAVEALAGLGPDAHLVVVGGGDPAPYETAAEQAGAARRLHFVGATEAPERFYAEADVFVLPTARERWGTPLIEAMASGVPVVTTEAAGASVVVRDHDAGLVLRGGSASELRDAVAALLGDPSLRRAMGERGRSAAPRFSEDAQARATLDVYRRVTEEKSELRRRATHRIATG